MYYHNEKTGLYTGDKIEGDREATQEEILNLKKSQQLKEIKIKRNITEQSGFSYLGKVFDSDSTSIQRLTCAAQSALIAKQTGSPFNIIWTLKDNSQIELDANQMLAAISALTKSSDTIHQTYNQKKEKIKAVTTLEELASLDDI